MKKSIIALICLILSACYYSLPADNYYADEVYTAPDYYSSATIYTAPTTSYFYMNEQRTYVQPKIIYIDDTQPHRRSQPRHYYYPEKHNPEKLKNHPTKTSHKINSPLTVGNPIKKPKVRQKPQETPEHKRKR